MSHYGTTVEDDRLFNVVPLVAIDNSFTLNCSALTIDACQSSMGTELMPNNNTLPITLHGQLYSS